MVRVGRRGGKLLFKDLLLLLQESKHGATKMTFLSTKVRCKRDRNTYHSRARRDGRTRARGESTVQTSEPPGQLGTGKEGGNERQSLTLSPKNRWEQRILTPWVNCHSVSDATKKEAKSATAEEREGPREKGRLTSRVRPCLSFVVLGRLVLVVLAVGSILPSLVEASVESVLS